MHSRCEYARGRLRMRMRVLEVREVAPRCGKVRQGDKRMGWCVVVFIIDADS
jgi:hypothetical protein